MIERIKDEILRYFPIELREAIIKTAKSDSGNVREIRIRINKPIILKLNSKDIFIRETITKEVINKIFESICGNSVYAFTDEISNGFITIFGGHRVGISGRALYKDNKMYSIKDISGLNFRIAREVIGAADKIINDIKVKGDFDNTLIISPPGLGKTTLLRDIVRQISNSGHEVSIVDERSEIAACFRGIPQNDVGEHTDVMDGINKVDGITMMVRSMKPDFIATDEIGTDEDAKAIMYAINSGVKVIATAHGRELGDLRRSEKLRRIVELGIFKKIVFLTENGFYIKDF